MQANIQASIAVSPSALGVLVVTVLKMLTSTRNSVTRSPMRPGITSIGIRKEIHETITNKPGKIFSFLNYVNKNTRDVMLPHQMEDSKL